MARTISASVVAQFQNNELKMGNLIAIEFEEGMERLTDWAHDIEWNGFTYSSLGYLLGISAISEQTDIGIEPWTITLSGVDQAQISLALTQNYINRRAWRWIAYFNPQNQLVADPVLVGEGLTDTPRIEDQPGGQTTLQLSVSDEYADVDGKNGRQTNDEIQQGVFPGDRFFEFVTETPKRLIWGPEG